MEFPLLLVTKPHPTIKAARMNICFSEDLYLISPAPEMLGADATRSIVGWPGKLKTFLRVAHQPAAIATRAGNLVEKAFRQRGTCISVNYLEERSA